MLIRPYLSARNQGATYHCLCDDARKKGLIKASKECCACHGSRLLDDDLRSDAYTLVEVLDVFVEHPDTAVRKTKCPIELGWLVPWIAYSPPERVIAETPIGLCGEPPGMMGGKFGLSRRTSDGGTQDGLVYFPVT